MPRIQWPIIVFGSVILIGFIWRDEWAPIRTTGGGSSGGGSSSNGSTTWATIDTAGSDRWGNDWLIQKSTGKDLTEYFRTGYIEDDSFNKRGQTWRTVEAAQQYAANQVTASFVDVVVTDTTTDTPTDVTVTTDATTTVGGGQSRFAQGYGADDTTTTSIDTLSTTTFDYGMSGGIM